MTTAQAVKLFKDEHTKRMYDRWIKDKRVTSIETAGLTNEATKLIKVTAARVLADLSVRTDTLAVGRPGRTAKCQIEAELLSEADISESFFCGLVQSALRRIRGVRASETELSAVDGEGYLTFTYKP